jgi:hypothetical protein
MDKERLDFDEAHEMSMRYLSRSRLFDFNKYIVSRTEPKVLREFKNDESHKLWADKYAADRGDLNIRLSDEERKICEHLPRAQQFNGWYKLQENKLFDEHAENLFTIKNSKNLLEMSDEAFSNFLVGDDITKVNLAEFRKDLGDWGFRKAESAVDLELNYFKNELENVVENEIKNEIRSLEKDILKDVARDVVIDVDNVVRKVETKVAYDVDKAVTEVDSKVIGIESDIL